MHAHEPENHPRTERKKGLGREDHLVDRTAICIYTFNPPLPPFLVYRSTIHYWVGTTGKKNLLLELSLSLDEYSKLSFERKGKKKSGEEKACF